MSYRRAETSAPVLKKKKWLYLHVSNSGTLAALPGDWLATLTLPRDSTGTSEGGLYMGWGKGRFTVVHTDVYIHTTIKIVLLMFRLSQIGTVRAPERVSQPHRHRTRSCNS